MKRKYEKNKVYLNIRIQKYRKNNQNFTIKTYYNKSQSIKKRKNMRFGQNLSVYIIPEWKQCYIDYQNLKIYVIIIKSLVQNIQLLDDLTEYLERQNDNNLIETQNFIVYEDVHSYKTIRQALFLKLTATHALFKKAFFLEMEMAELFYQMKTLQLHQKFINTQQIGIRQMQKHQIPTFLMLVEYIYLQAKYLDQMTDMNLQGERKILKKHKKVAKGMIETPVATHRKIIRFKKLNAVFIDKIENYYVEKNTLQQETKDRRQYLRKTAQRVQTSPLDGSLLGLWIGVSFSLLILLIVLVSINNISLSSDTRFSRDFPVWRGIAIFIFYVWILGFNIYMYEEYKITHRLIFNFNDHHYSKAIEIFKFAGLHTSLFLILFLLYVLDFTQIYNISSFRQEYFSLLSWGIFLFTLFIPLPIFNHKGRIFAFKLLFQSILSPCKGVTFPIVWMTDQAVSMATPLKDFSYSICYFTEINFDSNDNPCNDTNRVSVVLIVAVSALSYRIIQCLRQGYDKGEYFLTPFFFNTLKYASSLVTAVLAFQYKLEGQSILAAWLLFAAISTIYSYVWDLKMDWGLLQKNDRHPYLRKYLTFEPQRNYYIIIISNLIMRLAWTMTLSPNIAQFFGNANIFTLITGMIEILRRGIWNLLRVEKQHLVNCGDFKAVPDTTAIQNKLTRAENESELQIMLLRFLKKFQSHRQLLEKQFLALIREKIAQKQQFTKKYNQKYEKQQLKEINSLMQQVLRKDIKIIKTIKKEKKKEKKQKQMKKKTIKTSTNDMSTGS